MSKRRGNHEGSITKRKDGTWQASALVGYCPETGKPKRKYFSAKTRSEVQEKLTAILHQLNTGVYVDPLKITLGEWVEKWLKIYKKPDLKQSTYELYTLVAETHIIPDLGKIMLAKLQPFTLQEFYLKKLDQGISPQYIRQMHIVVRGALKQAIKEGFLFRNIAEATNPPKIIKKEMKILNENELKRFIKIIKNDHLAAAYVLSIGTGLRRGELLALKWKDIDFEKGKLTVHRQLLRLKKKIKFESSTKTEKGRSLPLPKNVVKELKAHKKRQDENKRMLGEAYVDTDMVFCGKDGTPIDPGNFSKRFSDLLERNHLPKVRLHDLRHSHASLLLAKGVRSKIVQERLGHSSIAITLDLYSHLVPGLEEEAVGKINNLFDGLEENDSE